MILAGITLYNPNWMMLEKNIAAIINQVDKLICIDNGSGNIDVIASKIEARFSQVEIIRNCENRGVAVALNQMFQYAKQHDYQWVLTLDQDSVCPENMIEIFKKYYHLPSVGCFCPVIRDRNYENLETITKTISYVDKCITSASFVSVDTWENVGGFFEELFIDFVDHDFCAKLVEHNLKIIRINEIVLEHEIGQGERHKFLGKRITALNHSEFRKYYMVRNWIYYMKAHAKVLAMGTERAKFVFLFFKTFLFEKHKMKKLKSMFKGLKDAKQFCKTYIKN